MTNASELSLNKENKRFEVVIDNQIAFIEYILNNENIMFLTHTEVPKSLEGKGIASIMVKKTLTYIKEHHYTVAPLCPFVAKYIAKHPEWKSILAKGYNV